MPTVVPAMLLADATGTLTWATVSGAFTNAFDMVTQCMTFVVDNSIFLVIFALGLIPLGFKIIKKAKKAVR